MDDRGVGIHRCDRGQRQDEGDRRDHAHVRAAVPDGVDMTELHRGLERLAGDLMVEIRLAEAIGSAR